MFNNFFDRDDPYDFHHSKPFGFISKYDFLDLNIANQIQQEILNIPEDEWDKHETPFEKKNVLKNTDDKLPPITRKLFQGLESEVFLAELRNICGKKLYTDPAKTFWGIHKFSNGDYTHIHVDEGLHPITGKKKQLTLCIYLSRNWQDNQTGALEFWYGDNAAESKVKIYNCGVAIKPLFNTIVLFNNDDYSWHGMPKPVIATGEEEIICLTISYFSNHHLYRNRNIKRIFCAHLE